MAVRDFRSQRLYVDCPLVQGEAIEASREQANYLLNVMRLADASDILIFNGRQGEWRARISKNGRRKCNLVPREQVRAQTAASGLIYCFAPLKQARLDYMVQKAVEMGVGVFQPVLTQYTQVRSINAKRILANIIEAAEQCGILALPQLREPVHLKNLDQSLNETPLVFCDECAGSADELGDLQALSGSGPLALLIGPEGGFSPSERDLIRSRHNVFHLGLGPRVLRADTAAVAALAIIQSRRGEWYSQTKG